MFAHNNLHAKLKAKIHMRSRLQRCTSALLLDKIQATQNRKKCHFTYYSFARMPNKMIVRLWRLLKLKWLLSSNGFPSPESRVNSFYIFVLGNSFYVIRIIMCCCSLKLPHSQSSYAICEPVCWHSGLLRACHA